MLRPLQQLGQFDQIKAQPFAARHVVGPAGDLDQAAPPILGAVAGHGIAQVFAAFVFGLGSRWAPDFLDVFERARLVANLRDKRSYTKHRGLLIQIFAFAVAKGLAERNVAELTLIKKEAEKKRQRHTLAGLMTIVDADTTPLWLKRAIRLALASLQRRDDIVSWLKSAVDLENNTIKVSPGKTQGYDNPIHLQIKMGKALREVVSECLRSPVASPYLTHYRPKARRREQIDAKDHWTSVTPNYLSNEFSKARDAAHAYDHIPATERPTFHEIRALGAWLYEQQNFPQEYIQALMGHADAKMTKHYQDGHTEKGIEYLEVGADLAF